MSGDASNIPLWADADVLIGDITATPPTLGTEFVTGTGLAFLGMVGTDGFTESQSNDSTDVSAFVPQGVVATARSNNVITVQVVALEDTIETLGLRYDTADVTPATAPATGYSGTLGARDLTKKYLLGFQTKSGSELKQRFTKGFAQVDSIGDYQEQYGGNVAMTTVTFKIYADNAGDYWSTFKGALA